MDGDRIGPRFTDAARVDLVAVLEAWRADAAVLARYGHAREAAIIRALVRDVETAATPWLTWLPENKAATRSGHAVAWLRARFAGWVREGAARMTPTGREYRAAVIPERDRPPTAPPEMTAFEAGRRGLRPSRSSPRKR